MSNISYNRRQICQLGLCSLTGLSLLGAGHAQGIPSVPISKTLRFIFWGPASRDKLTRKATDLYHSSHPDITINSEFTDFSSYWNKLNTEIAGGTIPDLIQMDIKYVAQYAKKGLLLDMTSIIANKTIDLSDFDPNLLASNKINQKAYGIPTGGNCMCLVYDADLVKKAGVDAPPATMTWEAFAGYTAQISKALAQNKIFGTADSSGDFAVFEIWIRQHGKELSTADGKLGYTVQDVANWFNYWSGLRKSSACASAEVQASVSNTSGPTTSLIIQKKVVFNAAHSNQFESYQVLTKDQLALQGIPTGGQPGQYIAPSGLMSISAKTKYVKESADFINFLMNDPKAIQIFGLDRGVPGGTKALAALTPTLTLVQKAVLAYVNQVAHGNQHRPKTVLPPAGTGAIQKSLGRVAQAISFGQVSALAGANTFCSESQKALAQV